MKRRHIWLNSAITEAISAFADLSNFQILENIGLAFISYALTDE